MPLSRSAREGLEQAAAASPRASWDDVRGFLEAGWKPGQHISIFGPNGYGKSTVLVELLELTPQPAILFVTKRRDGMIRELPKRGWQLTRTLEQTKSAVRAKPGERYFGRGGEGKPPRVLFWPTASGSIRQRRARLRDVGSKLLDWVYDHGGITVGVDEGIYAVEDLGLSPELRTIWNEARAGSGSLVLSSQRPSGFPKVAYSAPTFLIMFATNDPDDLKRLSDIGGALDPQPLRDELRTLPMYEFVFVAPRARPAWSVRSRVERQRR